MTSTSSPSQESTRTDVFAGVSRSYWWTATIGGLYFVLGFVAWGGSPDAIFSSGIFVVAGVVGLLVHYRRPHASHRRRVVMILAHQCIGLAVLIWQQANLPLSDYTATGDPAAREFLVYLVSALIVGTMAMFGGMWGVVLGLTGHFVFVFDTSEPFSFTWIFPVLIALAGNIVSSAFWRLNDAYARLEQVANHDHLTGLLNRHRLSAEFTRLQGDARTTGKALLLIAWDLDGLKRVNDAEGHAAGDEHIRQFAAALKANVRRMTDVRLGDAAFRTGGDEFVSLHLNAPDGEVLVSRLRRAFAHVSAGWVRCETLTLDQALTQADRALYEDKGARRPLVG